ncbi:Hsp20/alpha crystallin family protein, partial [Halorubrum sp. SD626R]
MSGLVEAGRSAFREALERVGRGWSKMQERRPLSYDLLESDDAYLVVFD